jgi:hypothetical protein
LGGGVFDGVPITLKGGDIYPPSVCSLWALLPWARKETSMYTFLARYLETSETAILRAKPVETGWNIVSSVAWTAQLIAAVLYAILHEDMEGLRLRAAMVLERDNSSDLGKLKLVVDGSLLDFEWTNYTTTGPLEGLVWMLQHIHDGELVMPLETVDGDEVEFIDLINSLLDEEVCDMGSYAVQFVACAPMTFRDAAIREKFQALRTGYPDLVERLSSNEKFARRLEWLDDAIADAVPQAEAVDPYDDMA